MPPPITVGSCALHKIEPKFRVLRICRIWAALFVRQITQHCPSQLAVLQSHTQFCQISRERLYVMVIIQRIFPQVIARQFACAPCSVKRMTEQIKFGDVRVQLLEKILRRHELSLSVRNQYKGDKLGSQRLVLGCHIGRSHSARACQGLSRHPSTADLLE